MTLAAEQVVHQAAKATRTCRGADHGSRRLTHAGLAPVVRRAAAPSSSGCSCTPVAEVRVPRRRPKTCAGFSGRSVSTTTTPSSILLAPHAVRIKGGRTRADQPIPIGKARVHRECETSRHRHRPHGHESLAGPAEREGRPSRSRSSTPRTLQPLDQATLVGVREETNRAVVAHEASRAWASARSRGGSLHTIVDYPDAPIERVRLAVPPLQFAPIMESRIDSRTWRPCSEAIYRTVNKKPSCMG